MKRYWVFTGVAVVSSVVMLGLAMNPTVPLWARTAFGMTALTWAYLIGRDIGSGWWR